MNKQALEIAKQSGIWFVTTREDLLDDYTKLIIQECAKIANGGWADPGQQINLHFGVQDPTFWNRGCLKQ